jgi:ribosomal RNA assembly protein
MELKFEEEILIPKARIAILIGKKGAVRKTIERKGKVKLKISATGAVKITAKDAFNLLIARNVVEAIGRGFNPKIAEKLFKEENSYGLVNLQDFGAREKSDLRRLRGIIIGEAGSAKNIIQQKTHTDIAVFGKTVAIIGPAEGVTMARHAIEMLLTSARHATVYRFLEEKQHDGRR